MAAMGGGEIEHSDGDHPRLFEHGFRRFLADMVDGLRADMRTVLRIRTMRYALVGVAALLFTVTAISSWLAQYYIRHLHVGRATARRGSWRWPSWPACPASSSAAGWRTGTRRGPGRPAGAARGVPVRGDDVLHGLVPDPAVRVHADRDHPRLRPPVAGPVRRLHGHPRAAGRPHRRAAPTCGGPAGPSAWWRWWPARRRPRSSCRRSPASTARTCGWRSWWCRRCRSWARRCCSGPEVPRRGHAEDHAGGAHRSAGGAGAAGGGGCCRRLQRRGEVVGVRAPPLVGRRAGLGIVDDHGAHRHGEDRPKTPNSVPATMALSTISGCSDSDRPNTIGASRSLSNCWTACRSARSGAREPGRHQRHQHRHGPARTITRRAKAAKGMTATGTASRPAAPHPGGADDDPLDHPERRRARR